jgi:hypothetical protein
MALSSHFGFEEGDKIVAIGLVLEAPKSHFRGSHN